MKENFLIITNYLLDLPIISCQGGIRNCNGQCVFKFEDSFYLCDTQCQDLSLPCHGNCPFDMYLDCDGYCVDYLENRNEGWICNGTCQNFSTPCEGKCHQNNWILNCNGVCESYVDRSAYKCNNRCLNIDTPCNLTCPNDRFLNCNGTCSREGNTWLCNDKCQSLYHPCNGFCPTQLHQNVNDICQILPSQQRMAHCKNIKMPCYGICLNGGFINCDGECVTSNEVHWQCNGHCQNLEVPCNGKCHDPNWSVKCNGICESKQKFSVYLCGKDCIPYNMPCNGKCDEYLTG